MSTITNLTWLKLRRKTNISIVNIIFWHFDIHRIQNLKVIEKFLVTKILQIMIFSDKINTEHVHQWIRCVLANRFYKFKIPLSLFLVSLSLNLYPFIPIPLSLSLYPYPSIPIPLSLSLYPYPFIPKAEKLRDRDWEANVFHIPSLLLSEWVSEWVS